MDKDEAKAKIAELVAKYDGLSPAEIKKYTEEDTKKGFIEPLFEALGWDTRDRNEVSTEERIVSAGRVDYSFFLNGRTKFYLEAKKLKADLQSEAFANQAIRYAWNRDVTWAVLTDFESLKVFSAQSIDRYLGDKQYFEIPYSQYVERFDQLWLLSKEAFASDAIDKEAEKIGKKLQKVSVTNLLYKDLNKARELLTEGLRECNPGVSAAELDEGIQKLLDRIIFLRVAEDRKLEPATLRPLVRQYAKGSKNGEGLYESMIKKFRELDNIYNSNLFAPHPFEKWDEFSGKTEKAIEVFYGKKGYYEYDFSIIPADVLGSVYENYLGYQLAQSRKGMATVKDGKKRKEQGIYYTPAYIVDYIVTNALKPVLDACESVAELKQIKVLDPACGSGSFLIKALDMIAAKYKELGYTDDELTRAQVLTENIYGVDLDEKAVEIARLNLLINTLDRKMKLPNLGGNIKNGNSLISGSDTELTKYFGKTYRDKKPFNWAEEFPEVFTRENPGFDVVIGNPPWVTVRHSEIGENEVRYYKNQYKGAQGFKLNLFPIFTELGLNLLRQSGVFSMIIPNRLLDTPSYRGVREKFIGQLEILDIENLPAGGFDNVVAGNIILTIANKKKLQKVVTIKNFYTDQALKLSINTILQNDNLTLNINARPEAQGAIGQMKKVKSVSFGNVANVHVGMMIKNKKDAMSQQEGGARIVVGRDLARHSVQKTRFFNPKTVEIFGGTKNPNKHEETPKLFIRKTGNSIVCAVDEHGVFAEQSVYLGLVRDDRFNVYYLDAVLNSKAATFYFQNELITNPEAYPYIQHYDLAAIPIPIANEQTQSTLNKLVRETMILSAKLNNESENSNSWHSLKSEIEKTDHRIDQLVYKLYDLSPDEIKIIESEI